MDVEATPARRRSAISGKQVGRPGTRLARLFLSTAARPLRFVLTGGIAGLSQLALLALLLDHGWHGIPANIVAFLAAAQVNFLLSILFTWHDRRLPGSLRRRWLVFHTAIAGMAVLNMLVFIAVRPLLPDLAASATGIAVAALGNFLIGDRLVFRSRGPAANRARTTRHGLMEEAQNGLSGVVCNDATGVRIEVEGEHETLDRFIGALREHVLSANDTIAQANREQFDRAGTYVINMMSSPGTGKTTLLERTLERLDGSPRVGVLEGDVQTTIDADRLARFGIPVVQINTDAGFGGACHLDANMVRFGLASLPLPAIDLLIIENVGNLICPADFQVGEDSKVIVASVAEGDEKPLKYPLMFRAADLVLVNKIDLLAYLDFDMERFLRNLDAVNPGVPRILLSARTALGIEAWCAWLACAGVATPTCSAAASCARQLKMNWRSSEWHRVV